MKNPERAADVAREAMLNAKYLRRLTNLLMVKNPSLLLRRLRDDLRAATPADLKRILSDVSQWQDRLWNFGKVGQAGYGSTDQKDSANRSKAWMNPVTPLTEQQELRVKIPKDAENPISVFLAANDAGDGSVNDVVLWSQPRLMLSGSAPIPLGELTV